MNQSQSYLDMHPAQHHLSTGPSYSHSATAGSMPHYASYQQSSVMQPSSAHYAPTYSAYAYNPVTSPQSAGPLPSMMPSQHFPTNSGPPSSYANQQVPFDTTGQIAPPGMKPRVTATLWEDEGSLCFQVEAKGVCVARREDNHFINGTKLLNVAGMTRGRRDGILKSEKTRHVVKIGPMHLKGVWIPFERALEFANKEKITDQLYPLFVHNIGGLLYNPENTPRTNAVVQAADRSRLERGADAPRPSHPSSTPSLHHHHSMQSAPQSQVPPSPHSLAPTGRPSIDRAHTFPTPPTSASSVLGLGSSASSYDWNGQSLPSNVNSSQALSIDTGINNARSMPTTPATTPPGNNVQSIASYPGHAGYESSKTYYTTTPSSQTTYSHQAGSRYDGYGKTDMGPPTAPPSGSTDVQDHKTESYTSDHTSSSETNGHHENGYINNTTAAYNRGPPYAYNASTDHHNLSPDMTSSPSHHNPAGRGNPRTAQSAWNHDYHTPPRASTANGLYNTGTDTRNSATSHSYGASTYPITGKRGRDDDDDKLDSNYKRQKMGQEAFGMPLSSAIQMHAIKSGVPGQR